MSQRCLQISLKWLKSEWVSGQSGSDVYFIIINHNSLTSCVIILLYIFYVYIMILKICFFFSAISVIKYYKIYRYIKNKLSKYLITIFLQKHSGNQIHSLDSENVMDTKILHGFFLVKSIGFPCSLPPHTHTHLHPEYRCPLFTAWLMAALQVNSSQSELSFLMPGSTVHLYFPTCHFSPEETPNQIPVLLLINSVISQFLTQQINTVHS